MKVKLLSLLALVMLCLAGCVNDDDENDGSLLSVGDKLPVFSAVTSEGSVFDTSTPSGKRLVLIFFNTGCPDCQRELPVVEEAYRQRPGDVEYLCISREESAEDVETYWRAQGFTMPYSAQTDRTVYNLFATSGIPRVFLINPEGLIVGAYGPDDHLSPEIFEKF